uniref:protein adenylyltransferase n=1 Tax=Macrostomum lignano TaxID=282301 RepID=A0A1I8FNW7_9PLAT
PGPRGQQHSQAGPGVSPDWQPGQGQARCLSTPGSSTRTMPRPWLPTGRCFEHHRPPDYVKAEHYYGKALLTDPTNEKAKASRKRTLPLVEQIDQARFNRIDQKVYQYYHIPETHPGLRRLKKEHYFRYVYHSNAIEGNTLDLAQTRAILETRIAVGGKSLLEHNEVLGLDAALMFLNSSLLRKPGPLLLSDLLEIHRRVLGYVDLQEAGRLRNTQVSLMADFLNWLNSEDTAELHPVEVAALAHWKLVYIHPFYDGNGRTASSLLTAQRVSDFEAAESGASLSLAKQSEDCKRGSSTCDACAGGYNCFLSEAALHRLRHPWRWPPPPPRPAASPAAPGLPVCPPAAAGPSSRASSSVRATDRRERKVEERRQLERRRRLEDLTRQAAVAAPAPARLRSRRRPFSRGLGLIEKRRRNLRKLKRLADLPLHVHLLYMQRYGRTRRGHSYKALLDVFPKEVMRDTAIALLDTMNEHGVDAGHGHGPADQSDIRHRVLRDDQSSSA